MIKMIVMDMDGTLLREDNTIDTVTREALLDVQRKGIRLVLASGRSYCKLMQYAKELQMSSYGGYLIEINGLALYDLASGKREVKTRLSPGDIRKLYEFGLPYELEMQALFDDGIYIYIPESLLPGKIAYRKEHHLPDDHPLTRGAMKFLSDNRQGYPNQMYIRHVDEITRPLNKVCFAADKDALDVFAEKIRLKYQDLFWIGKTTESWLEIMPKGITKGNALMALADKLHIEKDEILAFGDGENDIEMIQSVTYGIAMGNALAAVKEVAYDITDDHNHQGIAKVLKKYVF